MDHFNHKTFMLKLNFNLKMDVLVKTAKSNGSPKVLWDVGRLRVTPKTL